MLRQKIRSTARPCAHARFSAWYNGELTKRCASTSVRSHHHSLKSLSLPPLGRRPRCLLLPSSARPAFAVREARMVLPTINLRSARRCQRSFAWLEAASNISWSSPPELICGIDESEKDCHWSTRSGIRELHELVFAASKGSLPTRHPLGDVVPTYVATNLDHRSNKPCWRVTLLSCLLRRPKKLRTSMRETRRRQATEKDSCALLASYRGCRCPCLALDTEA